MTDLENNTNPTLDNAGNTNSDTVQNSFNSWEPMEVTGNDNLPENTIQGNPQLNISEMNMWNNIQASESLSSTEENGSTNNEIILWKFENAMTSQTEEPQNYSEPSKTLLENPAILENDPTENSNSEEEQQKAKLAQKEKLLQLIKIHESKAQKNWFTKWILSWIALTTVVILASFFFAKDQIIDLLNNMWWYQPSLSANIVNLSENLTDETENTELDEDLINETEERKWYNIKRVLSEQEANWVLPAHCSDLTCYGEDKEFAPCTTFRLSENLDENANRIGKNWVCKYKNPSELVYVEFN